MEPNFSSGDYLVVDEVSYRFRNPERGEVIVLHNPTQENEFFIKRIVGLPGEEVVITRDRVLIDDKPLDESYLPDGFTSKGDYLFQLDQGEYFVMGDNRAQSYDSRSWGPLGREQIVGTVRLRFWPVDDLEIYQLGD